MRLCCARWVGLFERVVRLLATDLCLDLVPEVRSKAWTLPCAILSAVDDLSARALKKQRTLEVCAAFVSFQRTVT